MADVTTLYRVTPPTLPQDWPPALEWITPACKRIALYGPSYVYEKVKSGEWQLFLVRSGERCCAAVLAEIAVFPLQTVLRIPICTGREYQNWLHHLKTIEKFAKDRGATISGLIAREGWARLLPDYNLTHVIIEKRL